MQQSQGFGFHDTNTFWKLINLQLFHVLEIFQSDETVLPETKQLATTPNRVIAQM
jgi:hypothetical protein